jgi:antitoxin component YwqK of YwqJK toxin-antitoxin module
VYRAGLRDGPWVSFHANGQKAAEGAFEKDQRVGRWTSWKPSGEIDASKSGVYEQNVRVGD